MDESLEARKERLRDELVDYLFEIPEKDFDVRKIEKLLDEIDTIAPIANDWRLVEESLMEFWEKYNPERARQLSEEYATGTCKNTGNL